MKPVRQEDGLGCAVACVAFVLKIPYSKAIDMFQDGKRRVREEANFYCPELVEILNKKGLKYSWNKLKREQSEDAFSNGTIVFIKRSKQLPYGHFLCRYNNQWMDPWENLPENPIKAGFRDVLPGKPTYQVFPLF